MDRKQTDKTRKKQIKKLIEIGTEEDKKAIERRDEGGLRNRAEMERREREVGL